MTLDAKYAHTNLIAHDWKRLAAFYTNVFGCVLVPPERDLSGAWLDAATSLPHAHIRGAHLRLPGYGNAGPTLEIFQYDAELPRGELVVNRPGFTHIAFAVADVDAARDAVLEAGGRLVGATIATNIPGAGEIHFVYVTDPEGNVIELQCWEES